MATMNPRMTPEQALIAKQAQRIAELEIEAAQHGNDFLNQFIQALRYINQFITTSDSPTVQAEARALLRQFRNEFQKSLALAAGVELPAKQQDGGAPPGVS